MKIQRLLYLISTSVLVIGTVIIGTTAVATYQSVRRGYDDLTSEYLRSTAEMYRSEIIGNIIIGDYVLLDSLLAEIGRKRRVNVSLLGGIEKRLPRVAATSNELRYPLKQGDRIFGTLVLSAGVPITSPDALRTVLPILLGQGVLVALFFFGTRMLLTRTVANPLDQIVASLVDDANGDQPSTPRLSPGALEEIRSVDSAIRVMRSQVRKTARAEAQAMIAQQVAHDIRSPLAALHVLERDLGQLPEDFRVLMRSALQRIRTVCAGLLAPSLGAPVKLVQAKESLLSFAIDEVVTELQVRLRTSPGIELAYRPAPGTAGLFCKVDPVGLRRVLCNLLDNAIEALPAARGRVTVSLCRSGESAHIVIEDNGKGIPPEILARLGERGLTYGKVGGNGLGLAHAYSFIRELGGRIEVQSQVTHRSGTTVRVELPVGEAPAWFAENLAIRPDGAVAIVDDDPSIHAVWDRRLKGKAVSLLHFRTGEDLAAFLKAHPDRRSELQYWIDYELSGEWRNGLDYVEELGIQAGSTLVTSCYDDVEVQTRAQSLGLRILPKHLAPEHPVALSAST